MKTSKKFLNAVVLVVEEDDPTLYPAVIKDFAADVKYSFQRVIGNGCVHLYYFNDNSLFVFVDFDEEKDYIIAFESTKELVSVLVGSNSGMPHKNEVLTVLNDIIKEEGE